MTIHVDLQSEPGPGESPTAFDDGELPAGATYCYHVGAGGELIVLVEERGESRIECAYSPSAWRRVRGDVWRKGVLLQG